MSCYAKLPRFVVLCLASASVCLANVSLVIPGFDPQPLSADIVGVGANNETTYLLFPGQPTGTWVSQSPAFTGTATLVENAKNVEFGYANSALSITVAESCTLMNGVADCAVAVAGGTTAFAQETVTPLLVQGGSTLSSAPTSSQTLSASSSTQTPSPESSVSGSSATNTASPSSATPSQSASWGVRVRPGMAILAGVAGMLGSILAVVA